MQKWAYRVKRVNLGQSAEEWLDMAGLDGWELVSVVSDGDSNPHVLYLRKPYPADMLDESGKQGDRRRKVPKPD
jgi:hypothetical protein